MSELLELQPFAPRDEHRFLYEMVALTHHHLDHCPEYRRIWPDWNGARSSFELPFLHVGLFKRILFESRGASKGRTLMSTGTSGAQSRIVLDSESSELQSRSTLRVLQAVAGEEVVPLLVIDHPSALRVRGEIAARVAAAMALRPLASEIHFVLGDPSDPRSVRWEVVRDVARQHRHFRVYGFTTMLWSAWGENPIPAETRSEILDARIDFVHSGGWKKLEAERVTRDSFDAALLEGLSADSRVIDYYGLVEQVGVIYPLCSAGWRHVPAWADVVVRDPWTLEPLGEGTGLLQLMNTLSRGAPYHSVLTEDLGRLVAGPCECGLGGKRFELIGRVPKAELRGCANV